MTVFLFLFLFFCSDTFGIPSLFFYVSYRHFLFVTMRLINNILKLHQSYLGNFYFYYCKRIVVVFMKSINTVINKGNVRY